MLFTANPVTGEGSESVINSNWGLGESVVSGEAEVDTFLVDKATGWVKLASVAAKEIQVELTAESGTRQISVPQERREHPSLTETQLVQLLNVSRIIEDVYQTPQDIEWAFLDDQCYILQSRPHNRS